MQDLALNPVTVALLLAILGCAALAMRRLLHRGLCDCGDHCDGGCSGCAGCAGHGAPDGPMGGALGATGCCPAAEAMAQRAEQGAKR